MTIPANDNQLWKGFNGHGLYAKRAEKDRNGEDIVTTYAKQSEVPALTDDLTSSTTTAVTPNAVKEAIDSIVHIPDTANQPSTLYVGGQGMGWTGWVTEEIDVPGNAVIIGGRKYKVVTIGTQEWMAESLDYAWDGLPVGGTGQSSNARARYYNNDQATYGIDGKYKCGLLYTWKAASYLDTNKQQLGIPDGWRVPTWADIDKLIAAAGNNSGMKLKSLDHILDDDRWPDGWNGTDDFGFCAVPSGWGNYNWEYFGTRFSIWTSHALGTQTAVEMRIDKANNTASVVDCGISVEMSIRLVKDV